MQATELQTPRETPFVRPDEAASIMTPPRAATREEVPVLDLTPLNRGEPISELARQPRAA